MSHPTSSTFYREKGIAELGSNSSPNFLIAIRGNFTVSASKDHSALVSPLPPAMRLLRAAPHTVVLRYAYE